MKPTILVVDDQAAVRGMINDYLTELGYTVYMAAHGLEAMRAAQRLKPALILLDIVMPQMDGLEFLRSYRRERSTPVIVLTAKATDTDRVVGLELGADASATKP